MRSQFALFLLVLVGCGACSKEPDSYSRAPGDLIEEAKPLYLARVFLREGDRDRFGSVLTRASLKSLEREERVDPDYFRKLRARHFDDEAHRFFTLKQWKAIRPDRDAELEKLEANLKPGQAIVVACTMEDPPHGWGPAIVEREDGAWKGTMEFRPISN